MKIIKLEQPNCRNCGFVENFLNDNGVEYESIDVMQNTDVAMEYGIMSTPVTILLDNEGKEVKRSNGYNPGELEEMIELLG